MFGQSPFEFLLLGMENRIDGIVALIFSTRKKMHENADKKTKSCSFLHMVTLKYVREMSPLMKDIADYLGIAPPSATSLINNLSADGLISREADKNDRRIVKIIITKKGAAYMDKCKKTVTAPLREAIGKLNEKEQKELEKILEKIIS